MSFDRSARLNHVILGDVRGANLVTKFGFGTVGDSWAGLSPSNVYQTPTTNVELEIFSDSADDVDGGSGAHKVTVWGNFITAGGIVIRQEEEVTMDGVTPVTLSKLFFRTWRMKPTLSGTYALVTSGSHNGNITLRTKGGSDEWLMLDMFDTGIGEGQTKNGFYTTPSHVISIVYAPLLTVEALKSIDIKMLVRENADDVDYPYLGIRTTQRTWAGIEQSPPAGPPIPLRVLHGCADIGFFARSSVGDADVSVDFWVEEVDVENWPYDSLGVPLE